VWPVRLAFAALALPRPPRAGTAGGQAIRPREDPGATAEPGKKIEVIEFFSYGCPHCADSSPRCRRVRRLPPDVQFRRVPVMFQDRWVALGKIYYTLDALGEESRLSPEVFKAIHKNGVNLSYREGVLRLGGEPGASIGRRSRTCTTRSRSPAR
jgi:thiol:disulfide interchange protein DsbA